VSSTPSLTGHGRGGVGGGGVGGKRLGISGIFVGAAWSIAALAISGQAVRMWWRLFARWAALDLVGRIIAPRSGSSQSLGQPRVRRESLGRARRAAIAADLVGEVRA